MRNQETYGAALMIVAIGATHVVLAQPTVSPQGPRHLAIAPSPNPNPVGLRITRQGGDGTDCMTYYVLPNGRLSVYPTYLALGPGQVVVVSDAEITPSTDVTVAEEFLTLPAVEDCCYSLSHAGCADPLCNDIVCQGDPYCCENRWDHFCAAASQTMCPHLGCAHSAPTPGGAANAIMPRWGDIDGNNQVNFIDISLLVNCFRRLPGAPLAACDLAPCVPDGINNFIDISQGVDAFKGLPFPCSDPCHHACSETGGPGCVDPLIEACVCDPDDWCCTTTWDDVCVNEVVGYGCDGTTHGCCETGGPGCDDPLVAACVCTERPECCAGPHGWDETCVAAVQWSGCGFCTLNPHSCCVAGEPSCQDGAIANCVCAIDTSCCDKAWDDACVEIAENGCNTCRTECACASLKFHDLTINRGTNFKADHKSVAAPPPARRRVTIDFQPVATLACTAGPGDKKCEGKITATLVSSDFTTHTEVAGTESIAPAAGISVKHACGGSDLKGAAFKYQIDLDPDATPVIGTIKITIALECPVGTVVDSRDITIQFDSRVLGNVDADQSDLDGDGLNGAKEKQQKTSDSDADEDDDGALDGADRFPRDKKKQ